MPPLSAYISVSLPKEAITTELRTWHPCTTSELRIPAFYLGFRPNETDTRPDSKSLKNTTAHS
jgi:hypothetical protein